VIKVLRNRPNERLSGSYFLGGIYGKSDWSKLIQSNDIIIHLAALAHGKVKQSGYAGAVEAYQEVNVAGTLNLAKQAAAKRARRFIFLSSIGVNGYSSSEPFTKADQPCPFGFYAKSKWEAEQGLMEIQRKSGMEIVIIRPPLVYGPNAPGNFGSLVRWVDRGLPLPLGAIHNKRSLVALDNLVDLIITCIDHPAAANQTFLVSDGEDLSTTELLRGVAVAMGKPSRLVPVPANLLKLGATLLGKKAMAQRLLGSLQVDISHTRECLGWEPPLTVKQGLTRCFETNQDL
jgi:nucleoside-diphosphate-sugar epimerase